MNLKLNDFILKELNFNINDVSIKTKLSGLNNECYKIEYLNTPYFIRICNKSKDMEEHSSKAFILFSRFWQYGY